MIDIIPHDLLFIISSIITLIMILLMFFMSIDDIKHTRIKAHHVILIYLLVMIYVTINDFFSPNATMSFLILLIVFTPIAGISKGRFGMGDALMISALGWYFASLNKINLFLYSWIVMSMFWALFWIIYLWNKSDIRDIVIGYKKTIPISELKAGMILASDNFVKGLNEEEIKKIMDSGIKQVDVKKPLPYIPCIFLTFLVCLVL